MSADGGGTGRTVRPGEDAAGFHCHQCSGKQLFQSAQWGIAFDFFKNVSGHAYDDNSFFSRVGAMGKSLGLGWGGDWTDFPDRPHLYLPDWGDTPSLLKQRYGTFENFRATWTGGEGDENSSAPAAGASSLVRDGQIHLNNYVNAGLALDGIRGSATKKAAVQSRSAGHEHGLRRGSLRGRPLGKGLGRRPEGPLCGKRRAAGTGRAVQILLLLRDVNPGGVDGIFGDRMLATVKTYQKSARLSEDGVAGYKTVKSLLSVS